MLCICIFSVVVGFWIWLIFRKLRRLSIPSFSYSGKFLVLFILILCLEHIGLYGINHVVVWVICIVAVVDCYFVQCVYGVSLLCHPNQTILRRRGSPPSEGWGCGWLILSAHRYARTSQSTSSMFLYCSFQHWHLYVLAPAEYIYIYIYI